MDAAATETLTVDRLELLKFFDEKHEGQKGDATGIVAIAGEGLNAACFRHYAVSKGAKSVEILPDTVGTGRKKGPRLDRWIKVDWPNGGKILYQAEIKNWSAFAIGGRVLPVDATPQEIAEFKQRGWNGRYNSKTRSLTQNETAKVLVRMKPPASVDLQEWDVVRPLLIFWEPLGHKKAGHHLFSVKACRPQPKFQELPKFCEPTELWVFSVSSYLRSLTDATICLPMPNAARRMRTMNRIFPAQ